MDEAQARCTAHRRRRLAPMLGVLLICAWAPPARGASVFIQVLTPAVTLAPTAADYDRDYVEATGAAGILVRIKTNAPVGMAVLVRCADANPPIALADLLVRTLTPPGLGGSALATYTPILATDRLLWSTGGSVAPFFNLTTDIRIRGLMNYDDAAGAGTTGYTDTLVYTVVAQ